MSGRSAVISRSRFADRIGSALSPSSMAQCKGTYALMGGRELTDRLECKLGAPNMSVTKASRGNSYHNGRARLTPVRKTF